MIALSGPFKACGLCDQTKRQTFEGRTVGQKWFRPRLCVRTDSFVPPPPSRYVRSWFTLLTALLTCVVLPADAFACASGGYARPGGYSGTPSLGSSGGYRTPSTSGGYSRPSPSVRPPAWTAPQSPGTTAFPKADPVPRSTVSARSRMMSGASVSMRRPRPSRRLRTSHTSLRPASMDPPALPIGLPGSISAAGPPAADLWWRQSQLSDCGVDCSSGCC